jgi:hypothetical protein
MDVVCCIRVVLSRKEKGDERVGVGGRGKYPGAPPYIRKKKRGKNKPTARAMVKGERLQQKKNHVPFTNIFN